MSTDRADPVGLLTEPEHHALSLASHLAEELVWVVAIGPSRADDLRELLAHVHAIQNAVLAQAAARAYPYRYRLLGGPPLTRIGMADR